MQITNVLSNLLDTLDIAVWELDTNYKVLNTNRKAREIYGDNAIGDFCFHVAAKRDTICPSCPARLVFEEGKKSGRSQHSRIKADGQKIHIDHTATPRYDESGKICGAVVSIVDITHIMKVEDELRKHQNELENLVAERTSELTKSKNNYRILFENSKKQEELYLSILNSSSDAIIVYEMTGLVQYLNPAFEQIFGWNIEELKNKKIPFLPESEREASMRHILALINDGTPCHDFRTKRETKSGQILDIGLSASRYADHTGKPAGMLVILRDLTAQVRAEKEALKARKLESVGVLAGGIAHDFNNILAAILANISFALSLTDEKSELHEILAASEKASLRAKHLTQQLLTFAKGGEPVKKITNIGEIIKDSTEFVLRGSNVKTLFEFAENLKHARIDAGQISQVVQNFVINADQAMADGGQIIIKAENYTHPTSKTEKLTLIPGDYLKISFKDQGSGIPAEVIDKIFDPYFSTKNENSGLGLAITHSIINKHQGAVTVKSETDPNSTNRGTIFTIYIPAIDHKEFSATSKPAVGKTKTDNITILIMDDEVMIREILEGILQAKGYKTIITCNGEEALQQHKESLDSGIKIDLSIMDLTVPGGMGGQEATEKLLKINPHAQIIVSSGYANDPIMAHYKDFGFKASLSKPFQMQELLAIIEKVLQN